MAVFRIKAEDGNTYRVEADDNASEADVAAAFSQEYAKMKRIPMQSAQNTGYQIAKRQEDDLNERFPVTAGQMITAPFNDDISYAAAYVGRGLGNLARTARGEDVTVTARDAARAARDSRREAQNEYRENTPWYQRVDVPASVFVTGPAKVTAANALLQKTAQKAAPAVESAVNTFLGTQGSRAASIAANATNRAINGAAAAPVGAGFGAVYGAAGGDKDTMQGVLGDALTGAGIGAATSGVLGAAFPSVAQSGSRAANTQRLATPEQVRQASNQMYQRADDLGMVISQDAMDDLGMRVMTALEEKGMSGAHKKVVSVIKPFLDSLAGKPNKSPLISQLVNPPGAGIAGIGHNAPPPPPAPPRVFTLRHLDQIRKQAGLISGSPDEQAHLARTIRSVMDDFLDSLTPDDVLHSASPEEAIALLKDARSLWRTWKKSDSIDDAIWQAEQRTLRGGDFYRHIKSTLTALKRNRRQYMNTFTPEERRMIDQVITGDSVEMALRTLSHFAPTRFLGGISGTANVVTSGATMNPLPIAIGAGVAGTGMLATRGANALAQNSANLLRDRIAGSAFPQPRPQLPQGVSSTLANQYRNMGRNAPTSTPFGAAGGVAASTILGQPRQNPYFSTSK